MNAKNHKMIAITREVAAHEGLETIDRFGETIKGGGGGFFDIFKKGVSIFKSVILPIAGTVLSNRKRLGRWETR